MSSRSPQWLNDSMERILDNKLDRIKTPYSKEKDDRLRRREEFMQYLIEREAIQERDENAVAAMEELMRDPLTRRELMDKLRRLREIKKRARQDTAQRTISHLLTRSRLDTAVPASDIIDYNVDILSTPSVTVPTLRKRTSSSSSESDSGEGKKKPKQYIKRNTKRSKTRRSKTHRSKTRRSKTHKKKTLRN